MVARLATPLAGEPPHAARRVASPTTTRPANPVLTGPGLVMCRLSCVPGNRGPTGTLFPTFQVGGAGTGSVSSCGLSSPAIAPNVPYGADLGSLPTSSRRASTPGRRSCVPSDALTIMRAQNYRGIAGLFCSPLRKVGLALAAIA